MYFSAVLLDSLTQHCSRDLRGSIPAEACGTKQVGRGIWEEALGRRHPGGRGSILGGIIWEEASGGCICEEASGGNIWEKVTGKRHL